jgi:hypothetical protein
VSSCNYVNILCELFAQSAKKKANLKAHYKFGNDPMKMCFKHKTRTKVNHKIKDTKILFLSHRL